MPLSRRQLIQKMRLLGFHGPYSGGKHQFMAKETLKVRIPKPHKTNEVSEALLSEILRQTGISRQDILN